jgi:hypothetical protein
MSKGKRRILGLFVVLLMVPVGALAQKSKLPVLSSISPTSTYAGGTSFILTVTGSGFTSGSVVQWNGGERTTKVVNSTQLQAQISSADIATAGTASVTVFTSGRFGGTSSGVSFTINAVPTTASTTPTTSTTTTTTTPTTTPTTAALTITTTSVPGGTAGASYASTQLAASGGSPAYTWSIPTGGGALPPGLALTAAGVVTGTPTAAGTYSFTAQAADQASQVAQKAFSMTIAAPPTTTTSTGGVVLFHSGFETADPAWDYTNGAADVSVDTAPPPGRSGNALKIHFKICGATDGTCGSSSQDTNRWVSKIINPGLTHVFVRGWVYYKTPESDAPAPSTTYVQRKVFYFSDSTSASNSVLNYMPTLTSWNATGGKPTSTIQLAMVLAGPNCGIPTSEKDDIGSMNFDTWNEVQMELQLNTPGAADGIIRIWLNGALVYEVTNASIRGTCSTPLSFFSVGRQSNRYNYSVVDEYRYWDDIAISTSMLP